jgi:transposase
MHIEGIGTITASAVVATVSDATLFNNGRQFAAWLA